jgi:hypothetical protein
MFSKIKFSGLAILLTASTRQDIDYDLHAISVSAKLVTPYGLFRCDPALLTGETRIDPFDNIVGISSPLTISNAAMARSGMPLEALSRQDLDY